MKMKIRAISARAVAVPMRRPLQTSIAAVTTAPLLLVDLKTDGGIVGRSYLFCMNKVHMKPVAAFVDAMGEMIKGDAVAPYELEKKLRGKYALFGVHNAVLFAMAAIDMCAWDALGQALNQQQSWAEAAQWLAPLTQTQPANPDAQFQYALSLEHLGQTRDALGHYAAALQQKPDFPDALQHAAWIMATDSNDDLRNGPRAVEMAARASELTGRKRPAILLTLAAAYAEAARFPEALAAAREAGELARAQGQTELEAEAARLRTSFEAGHPFHGQSK